MPNYDTGVACSLLGIHDTKQLSVHPLKGALLENLVCLDLLKRQLNQGLPDNLYYWRDKTGNEVDLLMDDPVKPTAVEIKSGATFAEDFQKGLLFLKKVSNNEELNTIVYYTGQATQKRSNGIQVKPWNSLVE